MTYIIDTNAILRYLLNDNPAQFKRVNEFMEKVRLGRERAIILESILTESVYVLVKFYKTPGAEAADKLITLLNYRGTVNKDKADLISALRLFSAGNMAIVDCIALVKAKKDRYNLFSFDEKLIKAFKQKGSAL